MALQIKKADPAEVGVRDLHNRTSEILRRVAAGEEIFVTLHGKRTAKLVPAETADPFADLRRRGLIRDPVDEGWMPDPNRPKPTGSISDLIVEDR